jgi:hypothetical protein
MWCDISLAMGEWESNVEAFVLGGVVDPAFQVLYQEFVYPEKAIRYDAEKEDPSHNQRRHHRAADKMLGDTH